MNKKIDLLSSPNKSLRTVSSKQKSVLSFRSTQDLFGAKSNTSLFASDERRKRNNGKNSFEEEIQIVEETKTDEHQIESNDHLKPSSNLKILEEINPDPEIMILEEQLENNHISKTQYM